MKGSVSQEPIKTSGEKNDWVKDDLSYWVEDGKMFFRVMVDNEPDLAFAMKGLDLAVLSVGGSNFPYVALGDSDATSSGQPTHALGYPFGRQLLLEDNTGKQPQTVPELSTIAGTISAIRSTSGKRQRGPCGSTFRAWMKKPLNSASAGWAGQYGSFCTRRPDGADKGRYQFRESI